MEKERLVIDKYASETVFKDFYFFNVGYEECYASHSHGPAIRENYLVHYIISGSGRFQTPEVSYNLAAGDFFLIRPGELCYYEADATDPWTYCWIGFAGTKVNDIFELQGIGPGDAVGQVKAGAELMALFQAIFDSNLFEDNQKLSNQGAFMQLFAYFKMKAPLQGQEKLAVKQQRYSESFLLYVQNNYFQPSLTIKEIARSMSLNPSYLSQVIRAELQTTPQNYLTDYQLNKASVLLQTSALNIAEITERVGYKSSQSFSRLFKKKYQCTPSEYREQAETSTT